MCYIVINIKNKRKCGVVFVEKTYKELNELLPVTSTLEKLDILLQATAMKKLESQEMIMEEAKLSYIARQMNDQFSSMEEAIDYIEKEIPSFKNVFNLESYFKGKEKQFINFLFKITSLGEKELQAVTLNYIEKLLGREDAEFTTQAKINTLLIQLLQLESGSLYDGTLGLGGTLLAALEENPSINVYGEDVNEGIVRMAKLRLFIEEGEIGDIQVGDVLTNPSFKEKGKLKQFDYVAMHAPFGLIVPSTEAFENDLYNRFVYGPLTRRNVDLAFLMHGIASIQDQGKGAFLMMGSPLMRGGADKTVRQNLLTADLIEAVIALPEKLLMNTLIPTYILIINKNKPSDLEGKVMFINASKEYEESRMINQLKDKHIEKIVRTYKDKKEEKDFSMIVATKDLEDSILLPEKYIVETVVEDDILGEINIKSNQLKGEKKLVKLEDCLTELYRGLNITSSTIKEGEGPLKIIKLSDVENGYLKLDDLTRGSLVRDSNLERYSVQKDDVIVSIRGSHIKVAVVPEVEDRVILSHNFIGLRLKEGIDPYYLKMYLESPLGQFELSQQQVGSRVLSISPANMKKIKILLTDDQSIGSQYNKVFKRYEEQVKQIEKERNDSIKLLYEKAGFFEYMTVNK